MLVQVRLSRGCKSGPRPGPLGTPLLALPPASGVSCGGSGACPWDPPEIVDFSVQMLAIGNELLGMSIEI